MRPIVVERTSQLSFNLTPMIDVIFQLIIFFLCVNQFERAERDERLRLPEAKSPDVRPPDDRSARLVVSLTDAGLTVDDQPAPADRLSDLLAQRRRSARPADVEVWIRADRDSPYSLVEPILLACARAGISRIAFQVVRADGSPTEDAP